MSERPSKTQKIDESVPPPLGEAAASSAMAMAVAAAAAADEVRGPDAREAYAPSTNPTWEHRLDQLRDFRATTGHTSVPNKYPPNPQLATWVAEQRR